MRGDSDVPYVVCPTSFNAVRLLFLDQYPVTRHHDIMSNSSSVALVTCDEALEHILFYWEHLMLHLGATRSFLQQASVLYRGFETRTLFIAISVPVSV